MEDAALTMRELVAAAAAELDDLAEQPGGRRKGRAVPDERALRYYTTIGLLDRPAAMRGRTALYGRRHLAQVVAIKRLQAAGRSLADIQALLPTLDDDALARAAGVELPETAPARDARRGFWRNAPQRAATAKRAPVAATPAAGAAAPSADIVPFGPAAGDDPEQATDFTPLAALELAPGVTLTIAPDRDVTPADAQAVRAAAATLLAELRRRHLTALPTRSDRED